MAGSLVSIPSLLALPAVFLLLFAGKIVSKIFGLYPVVGGGSLSAARGADASPARQVVWYDFPVPFQKKGG